MKRKLVCMISMFAMALGNSACATEYNTESNLITGIKDGVYRTIMIIKYDDISGEYDYDNIVYVKEASKSTFSDATQFLIKDNPEAGKYIIRMGGNGSTDEIEFYIGVPTGYMDKESDRVWKNDKTVSFAWEDVCLSKYNSVIVTAEDKVYCVSLSEFLKPENIDGSVSVGMQLIDVPEDVQIKVYLSKGAFSGNTLDVGEAYEE